MIIVIVGNPIEGLDIYGPFDDIDQAIGWGEDLVQGDWWLAKVESPANFDFS